MRWFTSVAQYLCRPMQSPTCTDAGCAATQAHSPLPPPPLHHLPCYRPLLLRAFTATEASALPLPASLSPVKPSIPRNLHPHKHTSYLSPLGPLLPLISVISPHTCMDAGCAAMHGRTRAKSASAYDATCCSGVPRASGLPRHAASASASRGVWVSSATRPAGQAGRERSARCSSGCRGGGWPPDGGGGRWQGAGAVVS